MKIKIHFTFLIYVLILYFLNLINYFFVFFVSILIHEFSHALIGIFFKLKIEEISIEISGISLKFKELNISGKKKILILLIGPIINIITGMLLIIFNLFNFAVVNIALGIFNLTPIYPLDGGKILYEISKMSKHSFLQKYNKICPMFGLIFFLITIFMYVDFYNTQILFIGIYILKMSNKKYYTNFVDNSYI